MSSVIHLVRQRYRAAGGARAAVVSAAILFLATLGLVTLLPDAVAGAHAAAAARQGTRRQRFRHNGAIDAEAPKGSDKKTPVTEAPTGFDSLTNGFSVQGPDFESLTEATVVANRSFNDNRFIFEEVETVADGLGDLQRAELQGVPPERRHRRREPGGGAQNRTRGERRVLRIARGVARSVEGD
jgi:hypothetical protein